MQRGKCNLMQEPVLASSLSTLPVSCCKLSCVCTYTCMFIKHVLKTGFLWFKFNKARHSRAREIFSAVYIINPYWIAVNIKPHVLKFFVCLLRPGGGSISLGEPLQSDALSPTFPQSEGKDGKKKKKKKISHFRQILEFPLPRKAFPLNVPTFFFSGAATLRDSFRD